MSSDAFTRFEGNPLLGQLPRGVLSTLLDQAETVPLAEGRVLFAEGGTATHLYLLTAGEVAVEYPTGATLRLGPGNLLGEEAVLLGTPHGATARAVAPAAVLSIDAGRLLGYLEGHFGIAIAMISAMAAHLREQVREITELKMQSTAERLAGYLVTLAGDAVGRAEVRLPCEKRQLADMLGMDPATLSRAFAKLRDKGVKASRSERVVIDDVTLLRAFGEWAEASN